MEKMSGNLDGLQSRADLSPPECRLELGLEGHKVCQRRERGRKSQSGRQDWYQVLGKCRSCGERNVSMGSNPGAWWDLRGFREIECYWI